jgi:hypothetical protein
VAGWRLAGNLFCICLSRNDPAHHIAMAARELCWNENVFAIQKNASSVPPTKKMNNAIVMATEIEKIFFGGGIKDPKLRSCYERTWKNGTRL